MSRRSRVPKLTLHKPTGQARVYLRGRQFYLGKHSSPAATEKYHRLIAEYLRTGEVPAEVRPKPASVAGTASGDPDDADDDPLVEQVVLRF
jgi:hypothetical protein